MPDLSLPLDAARRRLRTRLRHPAQLIVAAFLVAIGAGTALLALPVSRAGPGGAPGLVALFTASSAVCVTGLTVVDTPTYWSAFGHAVLVVLMQVGGLGIMALASLFVLFTSRRLGLRQRLLTQAETGVLRLGEVRQLLVRIAMLSLAAESVVALVLSARLWLGYGEPIGRALWLGVFHSVSSFNGAGFALYSDGLMRFVTDWFITMPILLAVVVGGLGFPVLAELWQFGPATKRWSLHTRLTLAVSGLLLVVGWLAVVGFEWTNPRTLGPLDVEGKLLASLFQGAAPRSAGLSTVDYAGMHETTWLVTDVLMFIGGGSASTAGGIKVTTFAVIGLMILAEARGEATVDVGGRRIPATAQRQALAVAAMALGLVVVATLVLATISPFSLSQLMFEAFSAFGTTGLSTGITAALGENGQWVLILLMFIGRTGPITLGSALILRERRRLYQFPEERPIIG
jgi:trk system potassium uptake protein TrkH